MAFVVCVLYSGLSNELTNALLSPKLISGLSRQELKNVCLKLKLFSEFA